LHDNDYDGNDIFAVRVANVARQRFYCASTTLSCALIFTSIEWKVSICGKNKNKYETDMEMEMKFRGGGMET
jgi:hypothetical protein